MTVETLGQKQRRFTEYVGRLIAWAYQNGYELTFGDAYRSPEMAKLYAEQGKGSEYSLHCERLAVDLNLFIAGKYQSSSEAYEPLGKFWKSIHPDCAWGGDFRRIKDGNHFSLRHGNMA